VYTVRCFDLQSLETGEDLRAGLRRIREAARVAAGCFLLLAAASWYAHAAIPPERLEEAIRKTEKSPEYDWRLPVAPAARSESWVVQVVDRVVKSVKSGLRTIGKFLGEAWKWLWERLTGGTPSPGRGAPPAGVPGSTYALTAIAVAAAAWLAWRWFRGRRPKTVLAAGDPVVTARLGDVDRSPDRPPPRPRAARGGPSLRAWRFAA